MNEARFFTEAVWQYRKEYDKRKKQGIRWQPPVEVTQSKNYTIEEREYFATFFSPMAAGRSGVEMCAVPNCPNKMAIKCVCRKHEMAARRGKR